MIRSFKTWWNTFEKNPRQTWGFSILGLVVLGGIAFLLFLGSTPLVDETEPLFAEAARQMTVTGDWITPYFNEETRFDKPPLLYWLMAIAYQVLGTHEWSARLPSALSAIALMVFLFLILHRFGFPTPKAAHPDQNQSSQTQRQLWISAWIGSTLAALNFQTIAWARTGVSDMLLSGCMGGALLCFFWGYAEHDPKKNHPFLPNPWYIACYILLSLAVLTKGPVGIVLPGLTILVFLLYVGQFWTVVKEMKVIFGALLFGGLTIPWFVLVILRNGQAYIDSFFGYHNIERFTSVVNRHSAPWYFYFLVVLIGFIPWSIYLPWSITRLRFWQRNFWQQQPRSSHLGLFALSWFGCIFVFFTVAVTKLPSYTLPLLPATSILVALLWSHVLTVDPPTQKRPWGMILSGSFNLLFLVAMGVAVFLAPRLMGYDPAALNWGEVIDQTVFPEIGATIWLLGASAIALCLIFPRYRGSIWAINTVAFLAFLLFSGFPLYNVAIGQRQDALKALSVQAAQVVQNPEEIMMIGFKKPSIVFYAQHPTLFFSHAPQALDYWSQQASTLTPQNTLLLICYPNEPDTLKLQPQDYQVIAQKGAYQLIRVAPLTLLQRNGLAPIEN